MSGRYAVAVVTERVEHGTFTRKLLLISSWAQSADEALGYGIRKACDEHPLATVILKSAIPALSTPQATDSGVDLDPPMKRKGR